MRKFSHVLFGLIITCTSIARADDEAIAWSWNCAVSGGYQLEVLPEGQLRPLLQISDKSSIQIDVIMASQATIDACGVRTIPKQYYVILKGKDLGPIFNEGLCAQRLEPRNRTYPIGSGKLPDFEGFEASEIYGSATSSLLVHREDADWRFTLTTTYLMTARESRRIRATAPIPGVIAKPQSSVSLMMGDCVMEKGK